MHLLPLPMLPRVPLLVQSLPLLVQSRLLLELLNQPLLNLLPRNDRIYVRSCHLLMCVTFYRVARYSTLFFW
jgi:hypothetical protein